MHSIKRWIPKDYLKIKKYSESDAKIVDQLEKIKILNEEIRGLKREHEMQSVRICEVNE